MRIWMDGCFDLMHFGHSNVFRKGRKLGDKLIVGVSSSSEIEKHKGICAMRDDERYFMVKSCRWVDEIIENAPYVPNINFVIEQECGLIVHGDDPAISKTGDDCYSEAKKINIYKEVSRTKFVSTTEMVGRMLLQRNSRILENNFASKDICIPEHSYNQEKDKYIDDLLEKFKLKEKKLKGKVVYIDGTFDLFHPGHASLLKKCKNSQYFVIVGIYSSKESYKLKGRYPIQAMKERILTVSACKYVDKILVDVPLEPDEKFIRENGIQRIVTGFINPCLGNYKRINKLIPFLQIRSDFPELTTSTIIARIIDNFQTFAERNKKRLERGC